MAKGKVTNIAIELNDGIGAVDGMNAILNALKEIDTVAEEKEGRVLEWDISKNAPGYKVIMRDEGVGMPQKFIVGKAKRTASPRTGK